MDLDTSIEPSLCLSAMRGRDEGLIPGSPGELLVLWEEKGNMKKVEAEKIKARILSNILDNLSPQEILDAAVKDCGSEIGRAHV